MKPTPPRKPKTHPEPTAGGNASLPAAPIEPPVDPTIIGRVVRPIGVHGEVKVISESFHPRRFDGLVEMTVRLDDDYYIFKVSGVKRTADWFRIRFEGIDTPESAAGLTNGEIVVPGAERPALGENEYYIDDLIGCSVTGDDGVEIGFLSGVMQQEHHDIWIVEGAAGEILIPAVHEFIADVDMVRHRITVHQIEGLGNAR